MGVDGSLRDQPPKTDKPTAEQGSSSNSTGDLQAALAAAQAFNGTGAPILQYRLSGIE